MHCFEAIRKSDYRERTKSPDCLVAASTKCPCCTIESLVIYGPSALFAVSRVALVRASFSFVPLLTDG